MKILYLIRGVSGTGKSTFAKSLGIKHLETDAWFSTGGSYQFDPANLSESHAWCFSESVKVMDSDEDLVVSNTFTQYWEMANYIEAAFERDYKVVLVHKYIEYGNIHHVPDSTVIKQLERFVHNKDILDEAKFIHPDVMIVEIMLP